MPRNTQRGNGGKSTRKRTPPPRGLGKATSSSGSLKLSRTELHYFCVRLGLSGSGDKKKLEDRLKRYFLERFQLQE